MSITTLPGGEALIDAAVLEQIEQAGRQGLSAEALSLAPELAAEAADLEAAIASLRADGVILKRKERWVATRRAGLQVGLLQVLERGDALIRSGARGEVGWFVRRRDRKGALDGDLILFKRAPKSKGRGHGFRLPEAVVVERVQVRRPTVVGTVEEDDGRLWLVPFDPKLKLEIEVEGADEVLPDQYVEAELDPRRTGIRGPAQAHLRKVLGSIETPGVDVEVILRHYRIPDAFPPAVIDQARKFAADPPEGEMAHREDLRGQTVVTIDGESSRDFDDAISIERLGDDRYRLGVHIADVSAYVEEGSPLDLEAYRRGTSVYYPDRAIPMLPESLSNGLCSLKPGVPRLTLTAWLDVEANGTVSARRFAETVIASARRYTYTEVADRLASLPAKARPSDPTEALLLDARALMQRLLAQRMDRGSIDFDLPEGDVVLDPDGFTVGVQPGERNVAHRIIEECMIAANEAVAAELIGHEVPALYRVHDPPDPDDLESLREVLRGLGIALKGDLETLHPEVLQGLLERVAGEPEEPFVTSMMLRAMQRAIYDPECRGHYALSSRTYTHFTSPIRRYPDLLVHRQLKWLLREASAAGEESSPELTGRLPAIAEHCSSTERRAEQSERTLMQWKLVRFLADRVGERFAGRITGVQPFGLFVQLSNYYVDGLVPVRTLEDDYYVYDPAKHLLEGRNKHRQFRLADPVDVVLTGVDTRHRSLDLKIV